jgi:hypothetical protein
VTSRALRANRLLFTLTASINKDIMSIQVHNLEFTVARST